MALSPVLFNLYVQPLAAVARDHGLTMVSYADDTQLVVALSDDPARGTSQFRSGLAAVAHWMTTNCLQLNSNKSEVLLVGRDKGLWSSQWWPASLGSAPTSKPAVKI